MFLKRLFPYALAVCFVAGLSPFVRAQSVETRSRQNISTSTPAEDDSLDEPVIISFGKPEESKPSRALVSSNGALLSFEKAILAAIDDRLGARYSWGGTGPTTFDCSGFVWSTFQAAGIDFERASARTLWSRFTAPAPNEEFKFGTLVFFSGLKHVGIVADEHGFYHASRHHGVVYSPFNDYWLERIDGFRRVPLTTVASSD